MFLRHFKILIRRRLNKERLKGGHPWRTLPYRVENEKIWNWYSVYRIKNPTVIEPYWNWNWNCNWNVKNLIKSIFNSIFFYFFLTFLFYLYFNFHWKIKDKPRVNKVKRENGLNIVIFPLILRLSGSITTFFFSHSI